MLEKMFNVLPDFMQNKLIIRMVYTAGSFLTARVIGFLTGDYLGKMLGEVVEQSARVGIHVQIKVLSIDQMTLEAAITGVLMIAGEFVIHHIHENYVKPVVAPAQAAAAAAVAPQGGTK